YGPGDVDRLMADGGIVRNLAKIEATIGNARRCGELVDEFGSFAAYVWRFEPDPRSRPRVLDHATLMQIAHSPESKAMSKDLRRPVGPEDERVEAGPDRQRGQLVDPLRHRTAEAAFGRPLGEGAADVEHPPDLARLASRLGRAVVQARRHVEDRLQLAPERRHPAVGGPAGQPQAPGPVGAEPDADRMGRHRSGLRARQPVVPA